MLSNLIGTFDFPSALVVLGIVAAFGLPVIVRQSKRISPADIEAKRMQLEFEDTRDKRAIDAKTDQEMARIAADRDQRMLAIERGTITSHAREGATERD